IELANAILDSVLFIFLLKLLDLFFGFSAFSLVMFTLIFFGINLFIRIKQIDLRNVEKKNPVIKDILRTANDYKNYFVKNSKSSEEDILVKGLYNDFKFLMHRVKTETFIDINLFFKKVSLAVLLSFLLVFASFISIDVSEFLNDVDRQVEEATKLKTTQSVEEDALSTYNDLFGEETDLINLDEGNFDISVTGQQMDMDVSKKTGFTLQEFEGYEEFYEDNDINSDEQFREEISNIDRELVKAYFKD
ncbi:hypothetical protein HN836_02190, partial [Candidatus Woesearchaeota archaeon]|nr:hypothetical protein [Candidatus Woesearchaeota archaeon]